MARLLTKEDIKDILSERFADDKFTKLSSMPPPDLFKDIKKASQRVQEAVQKDQKVVIVGDYDVDGVISSTILSSFFDSLGLQNKVIIPNRFSDGYGISEKVMQRADADLIVTVDNGISAIEGAQICKQRGIDLIITDHHTPPSVLPEAYAVINPKQNDCGFPTGEICGAQVAWYFAAAVKEQMDLDYDMSPYLDLLCIAIIADMMELKGLNRTIVRKGIKYLNNSKRPAFLAIKELFSKKEFKSENISFLIAPLLNSAGRMDDAFLAYEFLKSSDMSDAMEKLEEIVDLNNRRKECEAELFEVSLSSAEKDKNIIVVGGEGWHEGVIGIVAARLAKRFKKPAIVFSISKDKAKGSARSVGQIDILSLVKKQEDLLLGFGGHKGAAGVSVSKENFSAFKEAIEQDAKEIEDSKFISSQEILGELDAGQIDFELLSILENYEPYGQKNPKPQFVIKEAYVKVDKLIGRDKNHQKLILKANNNTHESLYFNFDREVKRGDFIDIVFTISKNEYRGFITPQLLIKQILNYE